jgi:hypothetical protein
MAKMKLMGKNKELIEELRDQEMIKVHVCNYIIH